MQSCNVHVHGFNHIKPFKSIVGSDYNVLYMWSTLVRMLNLSIVLETTVVYILKIT